MRECGYGLVWIHVYVRVWQEIEELTCCLAAESASTPMPYATLAQASRRVMRRLRLADQAKRETAKARNDLEAYVIATRDKVGAGRGTGHLVVVVGGGGGRVCLATIEKAGMRKACSSSACG